jgi:hypothetical protein
MPRGELAPFRALLTQAGWHEQRLRWLTDEEKAIRCFVQFSGRAPDAQSNHGCAPAMPLS